jgi:hypothetical protein
MSTLEIIITYFLYFTVCGNLNTINMKTLYKLEKTTQIEDVNYYFSKSIKLST